MQTFVEPELINGIFKTEIKNRFLSSVEIDGEENVCYIPSSCRLSNFIDMKDREVLLKPILNPKARTKYSLYAIKYRKKYILINLSEANRIIESQLKKRIFSFLGKRKHIFREKKIEGYKSDLFVEDTNTIIEVKCLLAFDKNALFPTVYSERAVKQLQCIKGLLEKGYNVCYVMVSLNPGVKEISINKNIKDYYELFMECVNAGMKYVGVSVELLENEPVIKKRIELNI